MNGAGRQHGDRDDHSGHSAGGIQPTADGILQAKARALIAAQNLPATLPARRWGGDGAGAPCSLCDMPIGNREIDIELELPDASAARAVNDHFHVRCLSVLEHELRQRERSTRQSGLFGAPRPGARGTDENQPEA